MRIIMSAMTFDKSHVCTNVCGSVSGLDLFLAGPSIVEAHSCVF